VVAWLSAAIGYPAWGLIALAAGERLAALRRWPAPRGHARAAAPRSRGRHAADPHHGRPPAPTAQPRATVAGIISERETARGRRR